MKQYRATDGDGEACIVKAETRSEAIKQAKQKGINPVSCRKTDSQRALEFFISRRHVSYEGLCQSPYSPAEYPDEYERAICF